MVATNDNVIVSDVESDVAVFVHDDTTSHEVWPVVCGPLESGADELARLRFIGTATIRTRHE